MLWNAIQCLAASGCQWRLLPRDFPPFTTVQRRFYRWPRLRSACVSQRVTGCR
ncbi:transposase [Rhizobium sp. 12,4]|uniref:transposase n=1 Tax=Rhizobium sp. 12,4 TaxID=3405135 RepID=UPI003D355487